MNRLSKSLLLSSVLAAGLTLSGCDNTGSGKQHAKNDNTSEQQTQSIMGAGSSFIYPVMSRWANAYYDKRGIKVNYQPIGSGGGQSQIFKGTVDFAASDQPLTNKQLEKHHLIQFPAIIGGIVPVIYVSNIHADQLTLSGKILADIYLGKIKKWNNSEIQKLNPDLKLPDKPIMVVHRADGSGTTYNFTDYLSKVSDSWKQQVGVNTAVSWPTGVGAKGNQGVAAQVKQLSGSIGYVEYAFALQTDMTTVKMINKSGHTVKADLKTFKAAAKGANYQPTENFNLMLTNQGGADSWPIVATTFILLPEDARPATTQAVKKFMLFAYSQQGDKIAASLDYVGLPKTVVQQIRNYWAQTERYQSGS